MSQDNIVDMLILHHSAMNATGQVPAQLRLPAITILHRQVSSGMKAFEERSFFKHASLLVADVKLWRNQTPARGGDIKTLALFCENCIGSTT